MKTFYFNIQSKGGAGKSMLTYLQALKRENDTDSVFVDLDHSTKTSERQLKFLIDKERLVVVDIFDKKNRIEREKLFDVLDNLSTLSFNDIYMDLGGSESEQLPNFFLMDFTVDQFKEFENALDSKFVFNIVVAGGPAYTSCMNYARQVITALKGKFDVFIYVNEYSFENEPESIEEIEQYAGTKKDLLKGVKLFGKIEVDRMSGQKIIENVKHGRGFSDYTGWATKIIVRRELEKV